MIFSKINQPYFFTFLKSRKLFSTYNLTDQQSLSQDEVNQILKKNSSKKTIMVKQEQKKSTIYEKDIKEQIQHIQSVSQLQNKLKQQEEIQHIQESSHHHHIEPKRFKYDLPIPNIMPEYPKIPSIFDSNDKNIQTINMKIHDLLQLNENSSYQQYELELRNKFNLAQDMYGGSLNEQQELINQIQLLQDMAIPMPALNSEVYMERMNRCVTLNLNLPGTIENEHPHKFLKDLRPVEDFRHTPLIPISEKQMKDHQLRVLAYHRKGFYFEMKSETIYNYIFIFMCLIIGFQMIKMVLNREEQQGIALERLKIKREQN